MKRHIIVEGCDGAGKDTLIDRLQSTSWGSVFTLHDRASTSEEGPVNNLAQWVEDDLADNMTEGPWIYNRHPIISEMVYGDLREINPGPVPQFLNATWRDYCKRTLAKHCVLVLVHPPLRVVQNVIKQQNPRDQMPGVLRNLNRIYKRYDSLTWPDNYIRYDRTISNPVALMGRIQAALREN